MLDRARAGVSQRAETSLIGSSGAGRLGWKPLLIFESDSSNVDRQEEGACPRRPKWQSPVPGGRPFDSFEARIRSAHLVSRCEEDVDGLSNPLRRRRR